MNIYYVNKHSTLRGPFDIVGALRTNIMRVGDMCIREVNDNLLVLLIVSNENSWQICKCLGCSKTSLNLRGNCLLFSFDGISRRCGNYRVISQLYQIFQEDSLHAFFKNALDILSYRHDLWDVSLFYKMLDLDNSGGKSKEESAGEVSVEIDNSFTTIFENFLDEKSKTRFQQLYGEGNSLKDVYTVIRKEYPLLFRTALRKFLVAYPDASIYDKTVSV